MCIGTIVVAHIDFETCQIDDAPDEFTHAKQIIDLQLQIVNIWAKSAILRVASPEMIDRCRKKTFCCKLKTAQISFLNVWLSFVSFLLFCSWSEILWQQNIIAKVVGPQGYVCAKRSADVKCFGKRNSYLT